MIATATQNLNGLVRSVPTWPVYLIGAVPPVWWFYLGITGGLGIEPIKEFEHLLGELALQMLVVVLAVTPLRQFTGLSLLKFRRALGLLSFYYISCHLLVWLVLDVGDLGKIWADIVKRPYITVGMVAFVLSDSGGRHIEQPVDPQAGCAKLATAASALLCRGGAGGGAFRDAGQDVAGRAACLPGGDLWAAGTARPAETPPGLTLAD